MNADRRVVGRDPTSLRWMRPCSRWKPAGAPPLVERDDLAVEHHRARAAVSGQAAAAPRRARETARTSRCRCATRAAPPAPAARLHQHDGADAVVLRLVDELGMRRAELDRRGQHRLDRTVAVAPGGWSRRRTQGGECSGPCQLAAVQLPTSNSQRPTAGFLGVGSWKLEFDAFEREVPARVRGVPARQPASRPPGRRDRRARWR